MSPQSEFILFGYETELRILVGGLKRQMLGYKKNWWQLKFGSREGCFRLQPCAIGTIDNLCGRRRIPF